MEENETLFRNQIQVLTTRMIDYTLKIKKICFSP